MNNLVIEEDGKLICNFDKEICNDNKKSGGCEYCCNFVDMVAKLHEYEAIGSVAEFKVKSKIQPIDNRLKRIEELLEINIK